jgi:hypothetical protein
VLENFLGKLICPNADCARELGKYSWIGDHCICEKKFVPSFAVYETAIRTLSED